jgi:hypothetical protein
MVPGRTKRERDFSQAIIALIKPIRGNDAAGSTLYASRAASLQHRGDNSQQRRVRRRGGGKRSGRMLPGHAALDDVLSLGYMPPVNQMVPIGQVPRQLPVESCAHIFFVETGERVAGRPTEPGMDSSW